MKRDGRLNFLIFMTMLRCHKPFSSGFKQNRQTNRRIKQMDVIITASRHVSQSRCVNCTHAATIFIINNPSTHKYHVFKKINVWSNELKSFKQTENRKKLFFLLRGTFLIMRQEVLVTQFWRETPSLLLFCNQILARSPTQWEACSGQKKACLSQQKQPFPL